MPDDLFFSEISCLTQLSSIYEYTGSSVIAVNKIDTNNIHKYGVIDPGEIENNFMVINDIVEKPSAEKAPSDIAVCGRYILNSTIFEFLEKTDADSSNEIQLTDAIKSMLSKEKVLATLYEGEKFDCGSKKGFVEATIAISLRDNDLKSDITRFIQNIKN